MKLRIWCSIIVSIAAFYSCSLEEHVELLPGESDMYGQREVIICATTECDNATKTVLGDDYVSVLWKPSDEINIFSAGEASKFTSTNTVNQKTANFSGSISVLSGTSEDVENVNIYGLYPYSASATFSGGYITTSLPADQTAVADTFDDDLFISIGKSSSFSMGFYNVCSGLRFSFSENGYESITITSNDSTPLAGTFSVGFDASGKPLIESISNPATSITVSAPAGGFVKNTWYYIICLPGIHSEGVTISAESSLVSGTYRIDSEVSFVRSLFKQTTNLDTKMNLVYDDLHTPLTFQALASGTITYNNDDNDNKRDIEYKLNDSEWVRFSGGTITVQAGDKVAFRYIYNNADYPGSYFYSKTYGGRFKSSMNCYVYGNIMSLAFKDDYASNLYLSTSKWTSGRNFYALFRDFSRMKNHPDRNLLLPATTLSQLCYCEMFKGCTGLTRAAILPAENMKYGCYYQMYWGCTGITVAPSLPAEELDDHCYNAMFGQSGVLTVPDLPATVMKEDCYANMFWECTHLTGPVKITATALATDCFMTMFKGCTGIQELTLETTAVPPYSHVSLSMIYDTEDFPVYVPDDLLTEYRTTWADYQDRLYAVKAKGI